MYISAEITKSDYTKALDRDRDRDPCCVFSFQADVEYDEFVPYCGSDPGDPLERHEVKVANA